MSFQIDTFEAKVLNQLTNGQNLDSNETFFDKTFTGNVEKVRVQYDFEYTWFASTGVQLWTINNTTNAITSSTTNFQSEGFEVGQVFEFYSDWSDRFNTSANFTAQITSILDNGKRLEFTLLSGLVVSGNFTDCGIWANAEEEANIQNAILVKFGLPENNGNDSFSSLLDNSEQKYETSQVNTTGVTVLSWASSTKSAQSGMMQVERVAQVNKNTVRYTLTHDLVINPYWLETDDQVILNPPNGDFREVVSQFIDRFRGNNCLRYISEIEVRSTYTNPQNRTARIDLDGNTGWFMDNFNSGSFKFEQATDIIYNGGATTGLVFGQPNTIEFTAKAINNQSIASNARFGVYTSTLPPPNRYQNTTTNFISNFAFDVAVNEEGGGTVNGENGVITNVTGVLINVSGVNHLQVNATIDFTGSTAQFDDSFVIWTGIETPNVNTALQGCNEVVEAGGAGITTTPYALDPSGGIMVFDFNAYSQVDKAEIIHNGTKKATTFFQGGGADEGNSSQGFDPANDASNYPSGDWYIGQFKGGAGRRDVACQNETGFSVPFTNGYQQRLWWVYTPADYAINPTVNLVITGVQGTAWEVKRICE